MAIVRSLALAAVAHLAKGAIDADEITSLPGWDGPMPSRQWSGYIKVPAVEQDKGKGNKFYHYWFVESEGNPKTDPVALWLNGGPGSSSLIGFFTENGPFATDDRSLKENTTAVPKLFHRETGWQKAASYIFLESPAGVGFSYCDYDNCTASDTSTAMDNHNVLKGFFKGFPEFAKNDFYISGESYAGVYCPTLAEQIMNDANNEINLKGLAVGNGCWGSKVGLCAFGADMDRINTQFLYGHGAISKTAYKQVVDACGDPADGPNAWGGSPEPAAGTEKYRSSECEAARAVSGKGVGSFEIYNYYDECYGTSGITMSSSERAMLGRQLLQGAEFGAAMHVGAATDAKGALNDYTCGGGAAMSVFLAQPSVQKALHVKAGTKGMAYGPRDRADLRPLYKTLAQKYRLLIYSGDADGCVPFVGTEEWTSELGFEQIEAWRPWQSGTNENMTKRDVTAGYVTTYSAGEAHNFTFLTVKGAGHMVPEFKPVAALQMLQAFFNNERF